MVDSDFALILSRSTSADGVPGRFINDDQFVSSVLPQLSPAEIAMKQRTDPAIQHVIQQMESGVSPPAQVREHLPDLPLLLRELNKLEVLNHLLMRKRRIGDETKYQLVLPAEYRADVLNQLHDKMGHLGAERTLHLIRSRFYWPKMSSDVLNNVSTCKRCVLRKSLPERASPLANILTFRPLELICMDFLSLEPDGRAKDILVMTDHFTQYGIAVPTPNQKGKTVAKCLWDNFLVHYGFPEKLHSDQGPDFEAKVIKDLCEIVGIHKTHTTPYHPRGNPVEHFNRTLLDTIGTLNDEHKLHWKGYVKPLVHAYNCTKNDDTVYSPYELMFGRQPRLPVDLAFGLPMGNGPENHSQYIQELRVHLEEGYQLAKNNVQKLMDHNRRRFNQQVTPQELNEGDRVLVKNVRKKRR
uniref:Gypsy retrotransposon integrase-like protein 1 n=1 Tax=Nothobranchius furzeri TaxID=105023 RepID=A0A8C6LMF4_NOTFU